MAPHSASISWRDLIIAGGLISKMDVSRFLVVSYQAINTIKENAIPKSTKNAARSGMKLFEGHI